MTNPSTYITTALQGIKALCEKATPGPWNAIGGWLYFGEHDEIRHEGKITDDTATFIAASRETMEKLVKALEHEMETNAALSRRWISIVINEKRYQRTAFVELRASELAQILTSDMP